MDGGDGEDVEVEKIKFEKMGVMTNEGCNKKKENDFCCIGENGDLGSWHSFLKLVKMWSS